MDEASFWPALEYRVSREMAGVDECARTGMWCDGFIAHAVDLSASPKRISGRAWIGLGSQQEPWTFDLLLPDTAQADAIPWSELLPVMDATQWLTIDRERKRLVVAPGDAVHDATAMIQFVGDELGEDGSKLRSYYCCIYRGGDLPSLPWGDELFDCVLVAIDSDAARRFADSFAKAIITQAVDYVQTTGVHAELLHDLVDEASVMAGVQDVVGDGHPMTTWHEDALSLDEMCEVARLCFGGADQVLCVVVGTEHDQQAFANRLRDRLAERS